MASQLQLPHIPKPAVHQVNVDVGTGGRWKAYRRPVGVDGFQTEVIGSSASRGMGLGQVLVSAVERGDSLSIAIIGKTKRLVVAGSLKED